MKAVSLLRFGFQTLPKVWFPAERPGTIVWWRRGDSFSAAFAAGWTMPSSEAAAGIGCGACYAVVVSRDILVPAP